MFVEEFRFCVHDVEEICVGVKFASISGNPISMILGGAIE